MWRVDCTHKHTCIFMHIYMKSEMILKLMCVMFAESGLKMTEIPCSTWNYFHLMLFQNKNYMYECMCAYIPLKKKVCKLIIQLHTLGNLLWRFCFPSVMAILGRPLEMHGKRGPQWRYCRLRFACRHICGGVFLIANWRWRAHPTVDRRSWVV